MLQARFAEPHSSSTIGQVGVGSGLGQGWVRVGDGLGLGLGLDWIGVELGLCFKKIKHWGLGWVGGWLVGMVQNKATLWP